MTIRQKITFENVNKINGLADNLIKWLKAQLKYNINLYLKQNKCKKDYNYEN